MVNKFRTFLCSRKSIQDFATSSVYRENDASYSTKRGNIPSILNLQNLKTKIECIEFRGPYVVQTTSNTETFRESNRDTKAVGIRAYCFSLEGQKPKSKNHTKQQQQTEHDVVQQEF
jgi:hypothetical protein